MFKVWLGGLFGFKYVAVNYAGLHEIKVIRKLPNNTEYVFMYGYIITKQYFLNSGKDWIILN